MRLARTLALGVLMASALAFTARAEIVAGHDYVVLNPAQPTTAEGKVEVIEFFWYGCPHCYELHPHLKRWLQQKPQDVQFRYVPAVARDSWVPGAKIFYALEALGELNRLNDQVYDAIHLDQIDLNNEQVLLDWVAKRGIDRQKFIDAYNSFAVQAKVAQARRMTRDYQIRGVPTLVVDGKYLTSGTYAGSVQGAVAVMDQLVKKARQERAQRR